MKVIPLLVACLVSFSLLSAEEPALNYNFDETSGTTISDSVGTNSASISGSGYSWGVGRLDGGLNFSGHPTFALSSQNILFNQSGFSISVWFRMDQMPASGSSRKILSRGSRSVLAVRDDGRLISEFGWGTTTIADSNGTATVGTWHHAVLTARNNGNDFILYFDGEKVAEHWNYYLTDAQYDAPFKIGIGPNENLESQWLGGIDNLQLFDAFISSVDVSLLYISGIPFEDRPPFNVALRRPAKVDSTDNPANVPENATDGFTTGFRWVSSGEPFPHWIEVELGNTYLLSGLKFYTGFGDTYQYPVTDYQLQYWDGWNWVDMLSVTGDENGGQADQTFTPVVSGERVRLLGTASSVTNFFRLFEVEIYGQVHDLYLNNRWPTIGETITTNNQPITIEFNEPITLLDGSLLRVRDPETNQPHADFTASVNGSTLTLSLDTNLPWDATVEVAVPAGVVGLASDPAIVNGVLIWEFKTGSASPQPIQAPIEVTGLLTDELIVTWDRDFTLVDGSLVSLTDLTAETELTGLSVAKSGNDLVISHPGLIPDRTYSLLIGAGAVADPISAVTNNRFVGGIFAGKLAILDANFDDGAQGFVGWERWEWAATGFSTGQFSSGSSSAFGFMASPPLSLQGGVDYRFSGDVRGPGPAVGITPNITLTGWYDKELFKVLSPGWESIVEGSGNLKKTFTPTTDGDYRLVVTRQETVGNGAQSSRTDDLRIVRAVPPSVFMESPARNSTWTESQTIPIRFDTFGFSGEISAVSVYDPVDERNLGTWSEHELGGYAIDWSYHTTPGVRDLEVTVTDTTGLETVFTRTVTITMDDGSLPSFTHWDFDKTFEEWTGTDSISRRSADNGPGSNALKIGGADAWFASPTVFLFAGETYTVNFESNAQRYESYTGYFWGLVVTPEAALPDSLMPIQEFDCSATYTWTPHSVSFTVPEDGPYHLTFWETQRAISQTDILFDNIRLIGNFNNAPAIELTSPPTGINTVVGSTVTLSADATDIDGTVTEVRFMHQTRVLAVDTEAPYTYQWTVPSSGDLEVHAVAYDNSGAFASSESVIIHAEANTLSVNTLIHDGDQATDDSVRQVLYQSDGTLVIAGEFGAGAFPGSFPTHLLNGATANSRGVVVRMSEDGLTVLSLTRISDVAVDMSLDDNDNIYIAAGGAGIVSLNPTADVVRWTYTGPSNAHRIDAGPTGHTATIFSPQADYDDKQLASHQIHVLDANGNVVADTAIGIGTFATDVAIDETNARIIAVGFTNFNTDSNPVDVPAFVIRAYDGTKIATGYNWGQNPDTAPDPAAFSNGGSTFGAAYPAWDPIYELIRPNTSDYGNPNPNSNPEPPTVADLQAIAPDANTYINGSGTGYLDAWIEWREDWDRWLNRPENNMADSRGSRCLIGPDGYLYLGFEFDGGNTPLRYDPFSLDNNMQANIVGGDKHHGMAQTSTVPKTFIGRYDLATGDFIRGQWTTARLNSGFDNTLRLDEGDFTVDDLGRIYVTGRAFANITPTIDHFPGGYRGGAHLLVFSPDFSTREFWGRMNTSGTGHGIAVSPSGTVALGGSVSSGGHFYANAWEESPSGGTDAFLTVGDLSTYFSYQGGEHPRLFFGAEDIPDLRNRLSEEPFQSMYQSLIEMRNYNHFGALYEPDHPYSQSQRAAIDGFLYVLTGDEAWAQSAKAEVEKVFANSVNTWADPSTKGLALYWMASKVAMAYDWCASSDAWDDAFNFKVSSELLRCGKIIIESGGSEQNSAITSNWQGARAGAGGLAMLASDHPEALNYLGSATNRLDNHLSAAYAGSGWLAEGLGYFYFPVGNYIGPFGIAMQRHDPSYDLRDRAAFANGFWTAIASNVSNTRSFGWLGVKPDWSDDGPAIGGEGVYGLAFHYLPEDLQQPYKWAYDYSQGAQSPYYQAGVYDDGLWDAYRIGTIWSYLYYPKDTIGTQPEESYAWHQLQSDPNGIGIYTFRNRFLDGDDTMAQFKARLATVDGHDGPDGLGFRIISEGSPMVVGGGRGGYGMDSNQATVYPVNPSDGSTLSVNTDLGTIIGTPLVTECGDGHIIGQMNINNVGVYNHKRWFVANYNEAATGAKAAFLVADTSVNGTYWQIPTFLNNAVAINGNTFTVTAPNGATMQGTILQPTSGYTITTGTKVRGSAYGIEGGVFRREANADPVNHPDIDDNRYIQIETTGATDFLVALTVVSSGGSHPAVSQLSGIVADASVQIGTLQIGLQTDDVTYDGSTYTIPDATVTFDAGAHGQITAGTTPQTVAYGTAATAPTLDPDPGFIFDGWDRSFDAVLRDMTVTATYLAIESVPSAPDLLVANAVSVSEIELSWHDNSTGETGFTIEQSSDGTNWSSLATVGAEETSYQHAGLSAETTVYYRVKATGTGGDSAWTDTASATTLQINLPPQFTNSPSEQAHEGLEFFTAVYATDPEGDTLSVSAVTIPTWLTLIDFNDGSADIIGTPTDADVGTHTITVEVSDGFNPAVELSWNISVNAAPEVSLVEPVSQPARVPESVGLYLEVSVSDETATDVIWSQVGGDGLLTFDAATGLRNGVQASQPGTYTIRASSSDGTLTGHLDIEIIWSDEVTADFVETIIDFGYDDLSTGSFRNTDMAGTTGFDFDNDGQFDDAIRNYNFREDVPLNRGNLTSPNDRNFYGGVTQRALNGSGGQAGGTVLSQNPLDQVSIAFKGNSTSHAAGTAVLFWDKQDFQNDTDTDPVFLGEGSELSFPNQMIIFSGGSRWLVRDSSGQYYISQTQVQSNPLGAFLDSDEIAAEMWAEYNPIVGEWLRHFDAAGATYDTPTSALGELTAFGMFSSWDTYVEWTRTIRFDQFRVKAVVSRPIVRAPLLSATPVVVVAPDETANLMVTLDAGSAFNGWQVISGPAGWTLGNANLESTTFSNSTEGTYVLRANAAGSGYESFVEATIVIANGYEQWIDTYPGVPSDQRGDLSDWDKDQLPNFLEYAFGLDPTRWDQITMDASATGGNLLQLVLDMAAQRSDVDYIVEVSSDLISWTTISQATGGNAMTAHVDADPAPTITYNGTSVTVQDNQASPRRFVRVGIVRP